MSNVMLAWELGGGAGHWTNLQPIAAHLQRQGHRVWLALRNVSVGRGHSLPITSILQAPFSTEPVPRPIEPQRSVVHILHNCGYAEESTLRILVSAWRGLFELIKPDLLICEYSPTALLASRGLPIKRVALGAGFNSPPDTSPLPDLQSWLPPAPELLLADEHVLLLRINKVLTSLGVPPLEQVSQLFSDVDETLFLTFPELDHYGCRRGVDYLGMWFAEGSGEPDWPPGDGQKVYVYSYPFPGIEALLSLIADLRLRALVNIPGFGPEHRQRLASPTIQFMTQRLDIHALANGCDAAILNGSNGAATAMLTAGKPVFNIPRWVEQVVYAHRIELMGAGLSALPSRPERIGSRLVTLLNDSRFSAAAQRFAAKYAHFSPRKTLDEVLARIERHLA
jgi:UDP:flavonoid glycosyltransferase YjiC (YdhE family)